MGPKVTHRKNKKMGAHFLTCNISGVDGRVGALRWIRTNSQTRVQNEINLHNQGKRAINAN
jgi:hypothetical protein